MIELVHIEARAELVDDQHPVVAFQHGRTTAAPMHMGHRAAVAETIGDQRDLPFDQLDIGSDRLVAPHHAPSQAHHAL